MQEIQEGHIQFRGFKTYYKIVGTQIKNKPPLLVLHGGPGSNHNYLLGLSELSKSGRQVIFYDQLGGGMSDMPEDNSLWTLELFLDEVKTVRSELNLKEIHLLGHSWGGMLAIEYLLSHPEGIKSAVLASAMISLPLYQEEAEKLKSVLPDDTATILRSHEKSGTTDTAEYQKAYAIYKDHYIYRANKSDYPVRYSSPAERVGRAAYKKLWGQSEACADGELKNWDRIGQLADITIPTLITSGQYDELTPWQAAITANLIPNSKLAIFTNGAHLAHIEQENAYLEVVREFLASND